MQKTAEIHGLDPFIRFRVVQVDYANNTNSFRRLNDDESTYQALFRISRSYQKKRMNRIGQQLNRVDTIYSYVFCLLIGTTVNRVFISLSFSLSYI